MTTLRDLEYQIQANTDGLNKAFPVLDKLVKSLEGLGNTVEKLASSYDKSMNQMAQSTQKSSQTTTKSANAQAQALRKQRDAIGDMKKVVDDLQAKLRTNSLNTWVGSTTNSFKAFERAMKSGTLTAYEMSRAKKRLGETLDKANRALRESERAQRGVATSTRQTEAALVRQYNAVERARTKYLDLISALEKQKAAPATIQQAQQAFQRLETTMAGAALTPRQFAQEMVAFNTELNNTRRSALYLNPTLEKMGIDINDITKSLQVALGPLSGVASRFSAFTAITRAHALSIALLIGTVISLVSVFGAAVNAASEFQSEMGTITKLLDATNHRAGITAESVDEITSQIEMMTSATDNMARQASLSFLSLENFSGDMLKQALLAAQGLALVGRGDMISQARRLAKILEDPKDNLKALTEAGVYFNAVEAEKIKRLQESGDLIGAQQEVLNKTVHLQAAATKSGDTLGSAWHQLKGELDNFLTATMMETGALESITSIIKMCTQAVQIFTKELAIAKLIGFAFTVVLKVIENVARAVVGTLQMLAAGVRKFGDAVDYVNNLMAGPIAAAIGDTLVAIRKNIDENVPKYIRVPGIDPASAQQLQADAKALSDMLKTQWDMIMAGVAAGELPVVDTRELRAAQDALEEFNIDPTIENFNKYKKAVEDTKHLLDRMISTQNGVESALDAQTRAAGQAQQKHDLLLSTFTEMRDEYAKFVADENLASDRIKNLTINYEAMKEALIKEGDLEGAKMLGFLIQQIEKGGTPLRKFTTGIEEQIKVARLQEKINGAVGQELSDLTLKQEILNNVMAAGISVSSDFMEHLEDLPEEIRKQVEAIIALTTALHGVNQAATQASAIKSLTQERNRELSALQNINASERERAVIAAELAERQNALNDGIKEGDKAMKDRIAIARQLVELDFAQQQQEALKSARDEVEIMTKGLTTAHGLTAAHEEHIAAMRDKIELERKYGKASEEELNLRKQIRALERAEQQELAIKALGDEIFLLEKQVGLFGAGTAAQREQVAQWRDMVELANQYGYISEEEMNRRQKIRQLDMLIDHQDEIRAMQQQLTMQDALVETYFQSEATARRTMAIRQKELDLIEKYGSLQDPMAQKELALFKAIQDRVAWIERNLKPIAEAFDAMFSSIEDGLVEFLSTGKLDIISWAQSLAEDVFRIMWRSLVTDPLKDALGGMLSNFLKGGMPGIPGIGPAGIGELGTMTNPMWVRITGTVPGLGGVPTVPGAVPGIPGVTPGSTLSPDQLAAMTGGGSATAAVAAAATGPSTAAGAVDAASGLIGLNESANTSSINAFLRAGGVDINSAQTAWCAAFVKSSLKQVGIETPGANLTATSFLNVGTGVDPAQVMRGDILVQARGLAAGQSGGHVGFATGATRMAESGLQLEMLGGNQGPVGMGGVSTQWINAAELNVQRLTQSTEALTTQMTTATQGAASLATGASQAATAATQFGAGAVPAATQAMQTMTTTGVVQATTGMTTTGTAALTTAASLSTLSGAAQGAALSAQAQQAIAANPLGGLWHEGGVVGMGGAVTSMWTGGFSGPRLAKGLMPSEFRAVLHRNEAVFNEDQLDALGNGLRARNEIDDDGMSAGGGNHFHFHGVTDASSFNKSRQQLGAWAAQQQRKADFYQN